MRYVAQVNGASLFFTERALTLVLTRQAPRARDVGERPGVLLGRVSLAVLPEPRTSRGVVLRLRFVGGSRRVRLQVSHRAPSMVNYLVGERRGWKRAVPSFERLTYRDVWPGIDLVFRGRGGTLKYEFRVGAGADVGDIRLAYDGAERLSVGHAGHLRIHTALGVLSDSRPVSYQHGAFGRVAVRSRFALQGAPASGRYGFALGAGYDRRRAVVVDPGLVYSTFIGGNQGESSVGTVDANGRAYVAGRTASLDFPTTPGSFDPALEEAPNAYVARLAPSGKSLEYATYLELTVDGTVTGLAADAQGSAYLAGFVDFRQFDFRAQVVVAKLDPTGSTLVYTMNLSAGEDVAFSGGIAVDRRGSAYVTGFTSGPAFPTTAGAYDQTFNGPDDAFVTKLNPTGSGLMYSTFLGGSDEGGSNFENGTSIAVDDQGNAYVSGDTEAPDFPTTPGAFDGTPNGGKDAFVAKLNPSGSALAYSTLVGGIADEFAGGIAVDGRGNAYVDGTTSSPDFPTTPGAFDSTPDGVTNTFVTTLNPTGSALGYSTFLGASDAASAGGIAVDAQGRAYTTGTTASTAFPTTPDAVDRTLDGPSDAFVSGLSPTGSALAYSTFLGGGGPDSGGSVAVDRQGAVYAIGTTQSIDYPTTPNAFDTTYNGGVDAFVTKLTPAAAGPCAQPGAIRGAGAITGTPGDDVICGSAGADRIDAQRGDDTIFAKAGDDRVDAGAGNDTVSGGPGNDRLRGGLGADRIRGDAGDDVLRGEVGNDFLAGGADADLVAGGGGDDTMRGEGGADRMVGKAGRDHVFGGDGGDVLVGGAGRDLLSGGGDDDTVLSVDGVPDTDDGGAGTDRCRADRIDVRVRCESS